MTFRRPLMLASALALGAAAFPAILSAQGGGGGGRGGSQEPPKNLQVLPKDMPRPQVSAIMNTFTAALGVNCAYCHTAAPTAALTISVRGPTRSPRCAIAELASSLTQRLSDSSTPTIARLRPNSS